MARDKKNTPTNNAGRPTGSYSSYGTSGYGAPYNGGGYGSVGNGGYNRNPYGAVPSQPLSQANSAANNDTKKAKANNKKENKPTKEKENKAKKDKAVAEKPDYSGMTRKEKKLAKKQEKFDEDDLRNYPMKVGSWIGTFILLAIPLVNCICAICWFFGVGNRSRAAWVRSKVVAFFLVIVLIFAMFGIGYGILASKAKNVEVEFDGVSYGTLGDYGAKGTLYYLACAAVDTFGADIIGQFIGGSDEGGENGGETGDVNGGDENGELNGDETGNGEEEVSTSDMINTAIKAKLAELILGIQFPQSQEGEGGEQAPEGAEVQAA